MSSTWGYKFDIVCFDGYRQNGNTLSTSDYNTLVAQAVPLGASFQNITPLSTGTPLSSDRVQLLALATTHGNGSTGTTTAGPVTFPSSSSGTWTVTYQYSGNTYTFTGTRTTLNSNGIIYSNGTAAPGVTILSIVDATTITAPPSLTPPYTSTQVYQVTLSTGTQTVYTRGAISGDQLNRIIAPSCLKTSGLAFLTGYTAPADSTFTSLIQQYCTGSSQGTGSNVGPISITSNTTTKSNVILAPLDYALLAVNTGFFSIQPSPPPLTSSAANFVYCDLATALGIVSTTNIPSTTTTVSFTGFSYTIPTGLSLPCFNPSSPHLVSIAILSAASSGFWNVQLINSDGTSSSVVLSTSNINADVASGVTLSDPSNLFNGGNPPPPPPTPLVYVASWLAPDGTILATRMIQSEINNVNTSLVTLNNTLSVSTFSATYTAADVNSWALQHQSVTNPPPPPPPPVTITPPFLSASAPLSNTVAVAWNPAPSGADKIIFTLKDPNGNNTNLTFNSSDGSEQFSSLTLNGLYVLTAVFKNSSTGQVSNQSNTININMSITGPPPPVQSGKNYAKIGFGIFAAGIVASLLTGTGFRKGKKH